MIATVMIVSPSITLYNYPFCSGRNKGLIFAKFNNYNTVILSIFTILSISSLQLIYYSF